MTDTVIYHNPACSTSRNTLALLRERAIAPRVVEYLKTPLDRAEIAALLARLGKRPRDLIRTKGDLYAALDLADDKWSDAELIGFLADHPALMERPVVVTARGARICRPVESVLEIL